MMEKKIEGLKKGQLEGKKKNGLIKQVILFLFVIPFVASIGSLVILMFGLPESIAVIVLYGLMVLAYAIGRKHMDRRLIYINAGVLLICSVIFTLMMVAAHGMIEGRLMAGLIWMFFPFFPTFLLSLYGWYLTLYLMLFGGLFMGLLCSIILQKDKSGLLAYGKPAMTYLAIGLILIGANACLYSQRDAARYAGHGFSYMNGYSSTDFKDYMVYSDPTKLVTLYHEPAIRIEDSYPVLDGAEACYPVYAAAAKAVYTDIETIEKEACHDPENEYQNGRYVTFTNSVVGMVRLIYKDIDIFFGAMPSKDQYIEAQEAGVSLEVTPIGKEAFVFFVEKDNPIDNLSSEQIRAIYHGDITNWSELGGKDQDILPFQRPAGSGSQTMMSYFMGKTALMKPKEYETVSSMEGVLSHVAQYTNEKGAMGYSFRYFVEELNQENDVKILKVDGVAPTIENVNNGTYPLTTNLCLITRKGDSNPNVKKMIDFMLSEDGQYIIKETGYAPLD